MFATEVEALQMDYLTITQAAERLEVDRSTVWRWVQEGHFEGVRRKGLGLTSPVLIPVESVEKVARILGLSNNGHESKHDPS
jgi:excisionase family DNA binding protein